MITLLPCAFLSLTWLKSIGQHSPSAARVYSRPSYQRSRRVLPVLCLDPRLADSAAYPEALRSRYYGLMCQSCPLLLTSLLHSSAGLCSLDLPLPVVRTFPTLSLRILRWMLGPLPRRTQWCSYPFLPTEHRPSPLQHKVGSHNSPSSDFCSAIVFGAAVISLCSGLHLCLPPRSLLPI